MNIINTDEIDFWIEKRLNVLLMGRHGVGKCLGKGTSILMYDGSTKNVENILTGDRLMGPDSKQRTVLSTCSGTEPLYKITPTKGDAYIVNQSHILSLKTCGTNDIININVEVFLNQNKRFRRRTMGYRTPISFKEQVCPIDPYFIGLWLGDGSSSGPAVTTADNEILSYLRSLASSRNLDLKNVGNCGKANTWYISSGKKKGRAKKGSNSVLSALQDLKLIRNKHIPDIFKINSRDTRLKVLAGLIDSDGSRSNNCFDLILKNNELANDVLFLCRSLGFAAYSKKSEKFCTYKGEKVTGIYNRISISGNLNEVPVILDHKQCTPRKQRKDVLKSAIKVTPEGLGEYFGFQIDGDGLFVLSDFTVTHNTEIIKAAFNKHFSTKNEVGKIVPTWRYFSAATMDPWVDFIGVPKEVKDEKGSHLELIKPIEFRDDKVRAIFFDEYNRAHKKVQNAVMELIQFKSINGRKFENLELIWAASNPKEDADGEDLGYYVEEMDPAQLDRFHIHCQIPYDVDRSYFVNKYGEVAGGAACDYWQELPKEIKNKISPRRLDYAIDIQLAGGNIRGTVLPVEANVNKLVKALKHGSPMQQLEKLIKEGKIKSIKSFVNDSNNWASVKEKVCERHDLYQAVLPYIKSEFVVSVVASHKEVERFVLKHPENFNKILESISKTSSDYTLRNKAAKTLDNWNKGIESAALLGSLDDFDLPSSLPATYDVAKSEVIGKLDWDSGPMPITPVPSTLGTEDKAQRVAFYQLLISSRDGASTYQRQAYLDGLINISGTDISFEYTHAGLRILDRYILRTTSENIKRNDTKVEQILSLLSSNYYVETKSNNANIADFIADYPALCSKYILPQIEAGSKVIPFKMLDKARSTVLKRLIKRTETSDAKEIF